MDKEHGRLLNQTFNLRSKSDYQITTQIDEEETKQIINKLDDFINKTEKITRKKTNPNTK